MIHREFIPAGTDAPVITNGESAAVFWRERVMTLPQFRPDVEWHVVLLLDTDRRLLGWVAPESDGARDWFTLERRKVLRAVVLSNAAGVVVIHNHPIDDVMPSEPDRAQAHWLAGSLEMVDARLFDSVVVSPDGTSFSSLEERGELTARQAAMHETRWKTWEEGFTLALDCLSAHDPRIDPLVSECAKNTGVSKEQWLADFVAAAIVRHFSPEPVEDRRVCLTAALYNRSFAAGAAVSEAARRAGVGVSAFLWDDCIADATRKWAPKSEQGASG